MASTITKRTDAGKPGTNSPSALTSLDPFSTMRDEINDLISRLWYGRDPTPASIPVNPAMDVSEDDNAYEIRVDTPGMKAEDLDIQVQGNGVTVSGSRDEEHEDHNKNFHRIERRSGSFRRTVMLPCEVDEDEVAAQYENGVLTVTLPKSEKNRAKKISVKS